MEERMKIEALENPNQTIISNPQNARSYTSYLSWLDDCEMLMKYC